MYTNKQVTKTAVADDLAPPLSTPWGLGKWGRGKGEAHVYVCG